MGQKLRKLLTILQHTKQSPRESICWSKMWLVPSLRSTILGHSSSQVLMDRKERSTQIVLMMVPKAQHLLVTKPKMPFMMSEVWMSLQSGESRLMHTQCPCLFSSSHKHWKRRVWFLHLCCWLSTSDHQDDSYCFSLYLSRCLISTFGKEW